MRTKIVKFEDGTYGIRVRHWPGTFLMLPKPYQFLFYTFVEDRSSCPDPKFLWTFPDPDTGATWYQKCKTPEEAISAMSDINRGSKVPRKSGLDLGTRIKGLK